MTSTECPDHPGTRLDSDGSCPNCAWHDSRSEQAIRALTIRQPWAGAIAHQTKRVENRTWKLPAKHEGARILIHAGAQRDRSAVVYGPHLDVYSAVVAIATLTGCHWSDDGTCCGPWGFDRAYHWTLADVIALDQPVPAKGRLGIWTPDDDLLAAVTAQPQPAV